MTPRRRDGAVGICESCGVSVLRQHVAGDGTHAAVKQYGSVRVACGGRVRPLWDGALGPVGV